MKTIFTIYIWNWFLLQFWRRFKEPKHSAHNYEKPVQLYTEQQQAEWIAKERYFKWSV